MVAPRTYECSLTRLMNTTYHGEIEKLQRYSRQGVVEKGRGSKERGREGRGREDEGKRSRWNGGVSRTVQPYIVR